MTLRHINESQIISYLIFQQHFVITEICVGLMLWLFHQQLPKVRNFLLAPNFIKGNIQKIKLINRRCILCLHF